MCLVLSRKGHYVELLTKVYCILSRNRHNVDDWMSVNFGYQNIGNYRLDVCGNLWAFGIVNFGNLACLCI